MLLFCWKYSKISLVVALNLSCFKQIKDSV